MIKKIDLFFCKEIKAKVTPATCRSRKKHADTLRESRLTPLYRACKFCNRAE